VPQRRIVRDSLVEDVDWPGLVLNSKGSRLETAFCDLAESPQAQQSVCVLSPDPELPSAWKAAARQMRQGPGANPSPCVESFASLLDSAGIRPQGN
jgi:hypothetical protein